jgi:hypothetical protein
MGMAHPLHILNYSWHWPGKQETFMATHGMIDLETLDVKPGATVLTLGAVKFDPKSDTEPHSELYFKIDIDEQDKLGRSASDSTIEWWGKQDPAVMEEAFDPEGRLGVEDALRQLSKWCVGTSVIWGQGYGFDMTILEDLYRSVGTPVPWNFWQIRDSRTLFSACASDPRKALGQDNLHNALADAYFQAKAVQLAYRELGIKR